MDALAWFTRVTRSAVTRVTVSWSGILLLCLCLSGCASNSVVTPTATVAPPTETPTPAPLVARFPDELLLTSWQLDGVVIDGKMQPPWNPEQCLAVGYRPEEYYFYTGCNFGYCDPERSATVQPDEPYVLCTVTVQGCVTTPDPATGAQHRVEWDQPFTDAMTERRTAEVRDGKLWLTAEDKSKPVLVLRRADTCYGRDNYLRPVK